jgi:hypothetical protein
LPLAEKVAFKTVLQKGNRVQVPKLVRWQFKMEPEQVLKVGVHLMDSWLARQYFYAKMRRDGRLLIPKLTLALLQKDENSLVGYVLEVTLEPA